ncbi:hypothetical protein JYT51_01620 [Candidatus Amoebophilus asiaticus]|nr:hypothetical protein [Candidatus Amoebophilus asiaticus]
MKDTESNIELLGWAEARNLASDIKDLCLENNVEEKGSKDIFLLGKKNRRIQKIDIKDIKNLN